MNTVAPSRSLLARLVVVLSSAAVAGAACSDEAAAPTAETGIPKGSATTPSGYPVCTETGGSTCCVDVRCDAPSADGSCPAADKRSSTPVCPCGAPTGPYAPGEAQADDAAAGRTCCYLLGSVACEGRPLLVDGVALVAALQRGAGQGDSAAWG